jgi:SAM-dependent methyltransferase
MAASEPSRLKLALRGLHWLSTQVGFDPLLLGRALKSAPRYFSEYLRFRRVFEGNIQIKPCLHDYSDEGGSTKNEYFWQDLIVARKIHAANPRRHIDIGSRVDGFVAHVASFRSIELIDIRPISSTIPGVHFTQGDLMSENSGLEQICDSLSCLHALEHFGLGRYGDEIDVNGAARGLRQMSRMLEPGGTLYLSTPVGRERVEFNANWVFDAGRIVALAKENGLRLSAVEAFIDGEMVELPVADSTLQMLTGRLYSLGMFTFAKLQPSTVVNR